jgi:hypothetical protein
MPREAHGNPRQTPGTPPETPGATAPVPILYEYAIKFICGRSCRPCGDVVARGLYYTAINVHNPATHRVGFRWKVAVGKPGLEAGPVSSFSVARLGPDEALEIDCGDIQCLSHSRDDFLKGFVVIQVVDVELDVVVVYTGAGATEQLETMDVERVVPRKTIWVPPPTGKPDLIPVPDANGGFCKRDREGHLVVTVKNQGTANAGPSVTRVEFAPGGPVDIPTPPIAAGASVNLPGVPIPGNCFNPDCNFRIIVDVNGAVAESDEMNNVASGVCIG